MDDLGPDTNSNGIIVGNNTALAVPTPEEKKPKTADKYLRFALKSKALIENLAHTLDWYKGQLSVNGGTYTELEKYYSRIYTDSQEARNHASDLSSRIGAIDSIAEHLRAFNDQVEKIYSHSADAAKIIGIVDPAATLQQARKCFETLLKSSDFNQQNLVSNGSIQADIDAIDQRLLPIIGTDKTFKNTVDAYHKEAPKRLANARKGTMPEGLDKEHYNHHHAVSPIIGEDNETLKKIPEAQRRPTRIITERRPGQFDAEGKRISGEPLYQKIKSEEASKLQGYSVEAETTRNSGAPAWQRRMDEENEKKQTPKEPTI